MKQHLQFCVYKITNSISGKSYIGKTCNIENRWHEHLRRSKNKNINNKFPNALRKYPEDTWDISILYETDDEPHCYEVEALLVDEYDTYKNGYNSCGGGTGSGSGENHPSFGKHGKNHPNFGKTWNWSQKQKDTISGKNSSNFGKTWNWSQERKLAASGENHPMFGKTGKDSPMFGKIWSQERKDTIRGKNSPHFGNMPWENNLCKSKKLEINWFYLDKVYDLRTIHGYGQKRIYDILVKDYPDIKKSPTSFQNMFRWIEKHGKPNENKDWLEFNKIFNKS